MFEELCRVVVLTDARHVHQVQASSGAVPTGDMSALCVAEVLLSAELALLSCYVLVPLEEQGPENVQGRFR